MTSMKDFIKANRAEIDRAIHSIPGIEDLRLNDAAREDFIKNDEGLYRWARRSRVNV